MDNWSRPFFRSMLSESDGNVSSARFCIVLVVVFSLGWVTALVLHDRKLPDLGAVSYTHLDVYKRQVFWTAANFMPVAPLRDRLTRCAKVTVFAYQEQGEL